MVRTALKIVGYCMGILMLFFCLAIWQKFFFYPKAWKAQVTVDGRAAAIVLSTSIVVGSVTVVCLCAETAKRRSCIR